MTGNEIRSSFLDFFKSKGHKIVSSDSLVPKDDPTVLFTTAGMQQFKPQFLGHLTGFTRAVSSQKCLRTDDLTEVGVTDFHHTMFEMLGNFSFGDYFKREAIHWAWEFLTVVVKIPASKLWVSVHREDEEAYNIWLNEIHLSSERIVKLGDKSNFWPSNARLNGPNGPCGPCSEIFFDWGKNDCTNPDCNPDCSCGRFCEVWNLVFTQYNRKDGGILEPLPAKNIDTGMGLERLTAVLQGKHNNFDSDLFQPIIACIISAERANAFKLTVKEQRIIADHIRAVTIGIADGVIPSNEGRGYVLRRLIVDMTNILIMSGVKKPLIHTFVPAVVNVMKNAYPELVQKQDEITTLVLRVEEGVLRLNAEMVPAFLSELATLKQIADTTTLPRQAGELMFRYRDTYGLSLEFIRSKTEETFTPDLARQADMIVQALMDEQKQRSRTGSKMQGDVFLAGMLDIKGFPKTDFVGYSQPSVEASIIGIFANGQTVVSLNDSQQAVIILDKTPFYAEQGGQTADLGILHGKSGSFEVTDTRKQGDVFLHYGVCKGKLAVNDPVKAAIDGERRMAVARNHTATHLLQAALRQVLGEHVKQQGSSVDQNRLRFDFTHPKALSREELLSVENTVNAFVRRCDQVSKQEMLMQEASSSGALAFFAEKYGETVRVITAGEYSKEFCAGTHLDSTGQIGLFKVLSENAVAQGIRRIEAVTGTGAIALMREKEDILERSAALFKVQAHELPARLDSHLKRMRELQKTVSDQNFLLIKENLDTVICKAVAAGETTFVSCIFRNTDMETLRRLSDFVRQRCASFVALLGSTTDEDGALIISCSDDLVKSGCHCGTLIKKITGIFGGSGGGRPNMAQAGCKDPQRLVESFEQMKKIVKESAGL